MTSNDECFGKVFDSNQIKINKVDYSYISKWLKYSWVVAKENYGLIFGIGLVELLAKAVFRVSFKSDFGMFFSLLLGVVLVPGYIFIVKSLIEKKSVQFSDLFVVFNQKGLLLRLLPFLFFGVFISILTYFFSSILLSFGEDSTKVWYSNPRLLLLSCASTVITFFISKFVLPVMFLMKLNLGKAISQSIKAMSLNFGPVFILYLTMLVLGALSVFTLGLAAIFVLMPMSIVQSYVVYATIFENLSPESKKVESV